MSGLVRRVLGPSQVFGHGLDLRRRASGQGVVDHAYPPDGGEIFHLVEAKLAMQPLKQGHGAMRHQHQGVAVGACLPHALGGQTPRGAWPVLHHHRAAQGLAHRFCQGARGQVHRPASGKTHRQFDRCPLGQDGATDGKAKLASTAWVSECLFWPHSSQARPDQLGGLPEAASGPTESEPKNESMVKKPKQWVQMRCPIKNPKIINSAIASLRF